MNHRIDTEYWQVVWNNFTAGDRNAFKIIYNEFIDALFSYGSRLTTDRDVLNDAIQDLFIDVYSYGTKLRKPESLEYYLFKSLKRIIIRKLIEQSKNSPFQEAQETFQLKFAIEEDIPEFEKDETLEKMQIEISDLIPEKKELLFLKFNSGLTYKEIGKMLDTKPNTVKKQVYRILDHLREKLKNEYIS